MRIFFVGSLEDNNYDRTPEIENKKIEESNDLWGAAMSLGKAAAQRGHTIMVGSERKSTIDYHIVIKGFLPEAEKNPNNHYFIEVWRPNDRKVPFEEVIENYPNVTLFYRHKRTGSTFEGDNLKRTNVWVFAHQSAISSADVIITLAGGVGTERAIYTAETLGKPVLPIASFKGASGRAYEEISREFSDKEGLYNLTAPWNKARGKKVIELAETFTHHSYFISYSHKDMAWCDYIHLSLCEEQRTTLRDRNQLHAGHQVQEKLYEAIGRAETFLLLWSENSTNSEWCQKELDVALKLQSKGMPPHRIVLIVSNEAKIPVELSNYLQLVGSNDILNNRDKNDSAVSRLINEEHA